MVGARWFLLLVVFISIQTVGVIQGDARDLTDVLTAGLTFEITGRDTVTTTRQFAPALSAAFSQAVSQAVTQEFPHASVAPAFNYRYNPSLSIFERSSGVPGPLFSERALTLGKGQLDLGVGYAYIDFSELNGRDLDNLTSSGLLTEVRVGEAEPRGDGGFLAPSSFSKLRTRIDLNAHVIVPALRYGITEWWDVSLIVPIATTFLRVRTETIPIVDVDPNAARFLFFRGSQGEFQPFGYRGTADNRVINDLSQLPLIKAQPRSGRLARAAGSSTGVGDIELRSKYQVWDSGAGGAAAALSLRLPSGNARDLHGTDETHLAPYLYLSHIFAERVEPHLNLGVDFNADDVDRSSFLWAAGASFLIGTKLGLTIDFLGRSEFNGLSVRLPKEAILPGFVLKSNRAPSSCTQQQPCSLDSQKTLPLPLFPARIKRNDTADFSFGIRYALGSKGSIYFAGLVPLNSDGFRADFVPAGGVEYTF